MAAPPRRIALMLELEWPYKRHSEVFAGIQRYAEKQGWETIIDEFAHNTLLHSAPNATRYDGIVSRANRLLARRAAQLGIPVVNVWPSSPARELLPGVFPDSTAVGRLLAEHLIARGFRRFATLTSATNMDNQLEIQEFTRVVQAAGFGCHSSFIPQDPGRNVTNWRKTERLLTRTMQTWQPPMGVYVGQEVIGRLIVQLIRQHGWRVPDDISTIAGKNQEILCERPRPSLTSVEIGYDRIGYAAAELLDQLMSGMPAPAAPIRIAPHGLVVRESTDFFAVDNPIVAAALRFIASHSHQRIGPDDVAQAVGTETRTLQNYFKKALARPIATEIRRVRIERAKRELAQGDRSLTAIAQNVGFGTIQRFYEVFQREIGLSPGEYRKQHQLPERR